MDNYFMGMPASSPYRGGYGYVPSYLSAANNSASNNTNIMWTMGIESAKAYPVMPGKTVLLMDSEGPHFFIKTVDVNGYATLKSYKFEEDVPTPAPVAPESPKYVTQEQLEAVIAELKEKMITQVCVPAKTAAPDNSAAKPSSVAPEEKKIKNLL